MPEPSRRLRRVHRARNASGQSIVEFALVLPVLVMLLVGILDLARVWTTMLSVESAAREAADYGTFGSHKWDEAVVEATPDGTLVGMERRACTAASNLPDYEGPDDACTNPRFSYALSTDRGATWVPYDAALASRVSNQPGDELRGASGSRATKANSRSDRRQSRLKTWPGSGETFHDTRRYKGAESFPDTLPRVRLSA